MCAAVSSLTLWNRHERTWKVALTPLTQEAWTVFKAQKRGSKGELLLAAHPVFNRMLGAPVTTHWVTFSRFCKSSAFKKSDT